jgi:hypothetical protein
LLTTEWELTVPQNGIFAKSESQVADIMSNQPNDNKVVFANVDALAKYLDISARRLRQYKEKGRLNYTTSAVLVDRTELTKVKQRIEAWAMTPNIPHRFRSRGGKRKSYRRYTQKRAGSG